MGEQGLGAGGAGSLQGRLGGVEGDQHPARLGPRFAYLQPHVVPILGEGGVIKAVEQTDEILNTGGAFFFHHPADWGWKKRECNFGIVALSLSYGVT
ncbi:hypothetical protein DESUT3_35610 [Desulfuromonas versatilis]|uniref:Uncharacterized protein n=1 Tax=Desulfuromonas versatilis TaxID=2802975 RepID=A0ABM8HX19_9BACT|nr:hypothetical protein DESUT3_35610 [Desulfuromonas versatilis]